MATQPLILIVAARPAEQNALVQTAQSEPGKVAVAANLLQAMAQASPDVAVVLVSAQIGLAQALELMSAWHAERPDTPFLFVVDADDAAAAGELVKAGASGYVREPVDAAELRAWIRKCLEISRKSAEFRALNARLHEKFGFDRMVAQSKSMRDLLEEARTAAEADGPVLVIGEAGTGKSLLAETIHHNSSRRAGPFVEFNVPATPVRLIERDLFGLAHMPLPEGSPRTGRWEIASGGTLYLDDVANLAAVTQSRFLRIFDQRGRPVINGSKGQAPLPRLIAGTARKIEVLATEGRFSGNLLRRISEIQLRIPPLRDRREDIRLLTDYLLKRTCETLGRPVPKLEPELLRFLERFDWPANVRQLSDCLETMVALSQSDMLRVDDLPASLDDPTCGATGMYFPAGMSLPELERAAVEQVLSHCAGNRTRAAHRLGISVRTLQRKLKSWSMEGAEPSFSLPPSSQRYS